MQKRKIILYLTIISILILQACNLPNSSATNTPTIDPILAAGLTLTAAAVLTPATEAPPTFTALPTLSPTPASTTTAVLTPTPPFAYVTLSEATNCRVGPGVAYDLVDTFLVGQTIEVIGKHPFDNYWYVRSPKNPSVNCWLWGFYATGGNLGNVPVLTPPPSPTTAPAPSFTAQYVNSGSCIGWWTRINLKNNGPVALKSISMSIKDTVTNETKNSSLDGFQDVNACILSTINSVLDPGESAVVVAPSLSANPSGHKVELAVTLCTETGQGGVCTSKTIEFTP
ncbi:MAG TPA: hypothetical protein DCX53_16980 [Anaerolineae bacterium]|nr:hypothetical protein [Anaerolineae bacterium]